MANDGNSWDFADGSTATISVTSHAWAARGRLRGSLARIHESQPGGISATITIHVVNEVHYVASTTPTGCAYTSWAYRGKKSRMR